MAATEHDLTPAAPGPGGSAVLPGAPRPATAVRELTDLPPAALRTRRRLLTEELDRVRHWHRLARARRDLLVAAAVAVEDLRVPLEATSDGGPLEHHFAAALGRLPAGDGLPELSAAAVADPARALRTLVLDAPGADGSGRLADQLRDLASAERRLAGYAAALEAELGLASAVFVERCGRVFGMLGGQAGAHDVVPGPPPA